MRAPVPAGGMFVSVAATSRGRERARARASILGPGQVGALAAAGVAEVQCDQAAAGGHPRHRLGAAAAREELGPGQIYESNGLLLATALQLAGAVPAQLGIVADTEEEHRRTMERALLGFDMLVTTGGASSGRTTWYGRCRRSSGRGGLLGRGREAGKARRLRRSPRPSRLQPSRQPRVGARDLRAARATGVNALLGLPSAAPCVPAGTLADEPCAATPNGTSSSERRWPTTNGEPVLTRCSARSRT